MAQRLELRDGFGRLLGWRRQSGCRIEGYDVGGRLIARCDMLTTLILKP